MTEIYVIRHVQAEGNLFRMMQGHWDGHVTELGVRQRDALAQRFKDIPIDAVYSSDLSRAVFTASAITGYHNIDIHLDKRLREFNVGPWEGVPFANVAWAYPDDLYNFMNRADLFHFEGAESFPEVQARAVEAITEIAQANPGKTLAVTSHGVTIRCMLTGILGIPLNDLNSVPIFANTGVAKLLYDNGKFSAEYINDASHLGELLSNFSIKAPLLRDEHIDPRKHRDFYLSCYRDAWLAAHGDLDGFDPEIYYACAVEHYLHDPASVTAIYDEDKPVGLLDLDMQRGAHAAYGWLSLIYLRPEYRCRGLGIQLLGRALVRYELAGRRSLRLSVSEDNTAALAFYRKWGFRELSYQSGAKTRLLLMERTLGGLEHGNV